MNNLDWTDLKLLGALFAGVIVAVLSSTANTWSARAACVATGLVFGFYGTEPLINWAGATFQASGWPYLICALLAMTGDRIARRVFQAVEKLDISLPWGRK